MRTLIALAALSLAAPALAAPATSNGAARLVVQRYYAALNRGDYKTAYALWDQGGASSGQSYAAFRAGFAQTKSTRVITGTPNNPDAGMSQRWIDVPVDVYATLKSGTKQHFKGKYTLHRVVAGVGAPLSQQSWHLSSVKLAKVAN
jgi:hypothetical protein